MKQGQTIGCVGVFIAVLLVTQASVYAAHFIAGGGRYSPDNMPQVSVRFQFLGVGVVPVSGPVVPIIETHIQFTIVHPSGSMPFRLFTSGAVIDPFTVVRVPPTSPPPPDRHIITITGNMLSKLVWGVEPDEQHLTEIVDFTVEAMDEKFPGAVSDSLTLTLRYNATQPTASRLSETLGAELVPCIDDICTLTLTGTMIEGEIESHTAGDE
ncbi:MAG: hypothetical protein OEU26_35350 [Candidatus Tectomicrobia bacterium]|nr:hypothetical protein [Candidatus Tectomicrobia bacterium]